VCGKHLKSAMTRSLESEPFGTVASVWRIYP
jgi:hypothetical protein